MSQPKRLGAREVRAGLESGTAVLVCAYPSDAKFEQAALEGAISFREFERRKTSLPRGFGIVFY